MTLIYYGSKLYDPCVQVLHRACFSLTRPTPFPKELPIHAEGDHSTYFLSLMKFLRSCLEQYINVLDNQKMAIIISIYAV